MGDQICIGAFGASGGASCYSQDFQRAPTRAECIDFISARYLVNKQPYRDASQALTAYREQCSRLTTEVRATFQVPGS